MRSFNDSRGRSWQVDVNIGSVGRVKRMTGVDLMQQLDPASTEADPRPPLMARLLDDLPLLGDVLYALVQPQAAALNVSEEQFLELLHGPAIQDAHSKLFAELVDFFQSLNRPELVTVLQVQIQTLERLMKQIRQATTPEMVTQAVDQILSPTSGPSPELSESTPAN